MSRDVVESALTVDATTPFDAAQKASNGTVTYRRDEDEWIKVTRVRGSTPFGFVRTQHYFGRGDVPDME